MRNVGRPIKDQWSRVLLKRALIPATRSRSEGSDRTRETLRLGSNLPVHWPINGWTQYASNGLSSNDAAGLRTVDQLGAGSNL